MPTEARTAATAQLAALPRLVAVAVGLPVAIAAVDYLLIAASSSVRPLVLLLPPLFVLQVGILGVCLGRFLDNVPVRCLVFAWALALVDALTLTTMFFGGGGFGLELVIFALFSAQVGLLTIWGMLGRMPWPLRIPLFLVMVVGAVSWLVRSSASIQWWLEDFELWGMILASQIGALVLVCGLLRVTGYSLRHEQPQTTPTTPASGEAQFQFAIKHLLFWMTSTAVVLLLARGVDFLFLQSHELFYAAQLGIGLAIVNCTALYAALSHRGRLLRLAVLVFAAPLAGALLAWLTSRWVLSRASPAMWLFRQLREFGWSWIIWAVLAAWFLAAALLIFRSSGYRLLRAARGRVSTS